MRSNKKSNTALNQWTGIKFPFQIGKTSFPESVSGVALIKQSFLQILLTTPGEYVFLPTFGSNIQSIVFSNTGPILVQMVRAEVLSAITKWESRATITSINVNSVDSIVYIDINFVVNSSGISDTVGLALNAA